MRISFFGRSYVSLDWPAIISNISKPSIKANYLVVSTIPQYYTKVRPVTNKEIQEGMYELGTLLRHVAYLICYKGYSL